MEAPTKWHIIHTPGKRPRPRMFKPRGLLVILFTLIILALTFVFFWAHA